VFVAGIQRAGAEAALLAELVGTASVGAAVTGALLGVRATVVVDSVAAPADLGEGVATLCATGVTSKELAVVVDTAVTASGVTTGVLIVVGLTVPDGAPWHATREAARTSAQTSTLGRGRRGTDTYRVFLRYGGRSTQRSSRLTGSTTTSKSRELRLPSSVIDRPRWNR